MEQFQIEYLLILKQLDQEADKAWSEYNLYCRGIDSGGREVSPIQSETDRLYSLYQEKYNQYKKLHSKFTKVIGYIEIQKPQDIIGCRLVRGAFGKIKVYSVNDLTKIQLSSIKHEGYVETPYALSLEGKATRIQKVNTYKIKRCEDKVYWVPNESELFRLI